MNDITFFPIITEVEDDLGQTEEVQDFSRKVFCERKSVPQSEYFQAGQSGIKASCVIIVHQFDYQDDESLKYNNKIYRIYRRYDRNDEKVELYCEVRSGG
jgi:SPP1 family predicted phage head-tail adaptor